MSEAEVEYNFAVSNYSYACTIEEKLHNALAILNIIQGLGISVDETRESINTQLKVQANLKKNYKEIINKYEIERLVNKKFRSINRTLTLKKCKLAQTNLEQETESLVNNEIQEVNGVNSRSNSSSSPEL
ncbi:13995_t:CDS:2 [Dentiscutata erythropus]|uniref:13995_t:CDS:1 n=1 Tax=Dentiscutata erythropus TaxID=1348616 RepID=A0A9N9JYX3_9GLOM|nr:13995_t:CDS:2 [Dentiscutata erythropus]